MPLEPVSKASIKHNLKVRTPRKMDFSPKLYQYPHGAAGLGTVSLPPPNENQFTDSLTKDSPGKPAQYPPYCQPRPVSRPSRPVSQQETKSVTAPQPQPLHTTRPGQPFSPYNGEFPAGLGSPFPANYSPYTFSPAPVPQDMPLPYELPPPYPPPSFPVEQPTTYTYPPNPVYPPPALFTTFHSMPNESERPNQGDFASFPSPSRKKIKRVSPKPDSLPEPGQMPEIEDDGEKPGYSYAGLIAHAILRAPERRLTLAQIYKWISDTFAFYRGGGVGWQNSIRHNLSLNKAFQKQERPKNDSGKGNYWTIVPGMEMQFIKEKPTRKGTSIAQLAALAKPAPLAGALAPQQWAPLREPSSDATIVLEEPESEPKPVERISEQILEPINSSPPMPPPVASLPRRAEVSPSPAPRSRKRKAEVLEGRDSGYFSSLESSVRKAYGHGRAEEEIARIRSDRIERSDPIRPLSVSSDEPRSDEPSPSIHVEYVSPAHIREPSTPLASATPNRILSPTECLRLHRAQVALLQSSPSQDLSPPYSPLFHLPRSKVDLANLATPSIHAYFSPIKSAVTPKSRPHLWIERVRNQAIDTPSRAVQTPPKIDPDKDSVNWKDWIKTPHQYVETEDGYRRRSPLFKEMRQCK